MIPSGHENGGFPVQKKRESTTLFNAEGLSDISDQIVQFVQISGREARLKTRKKLS
jgi:hypothetical protein